MSLSTQGQKRLNELFEKFRRLYLEDFHAHGKKPSKADVEEAFLELVDTELSTNPNLEDRWDE